MKIDVLNSEGDEINLAPLIDCVFLLLIFFMVATTFEQSEERPEPIEELLIELPVASASIDTMNLSRPLVISIDHKGRFYIEGKRANVSDLHQTLKQVAATTPDRRIRIDGDKEVAYQHVAHVLDLCQFVGLKHIGTRMN